MLGEWIATLLGPIGLAIVVVACAAPEVEPCVEGIDPGDTFHARLVEPYDWTPLAEGGYFDESYRFDENCNAERDQLTPGPLEFTALQWLGENGDPRKDCKRLALSVSPTDKLIPGEATPVDYGGLGGGGPYVGVASHYGAVVDGCERVWRGSIGATGAPYATSVPGGDPPAFLRRTIEDTDSSCDYDEVGNDCLFVVQLEATGP